MVSLPRRTPLRRGVGVARGGKIVYRPDPTDAELDQLAGDLVKWLAGYRCERCGTQYPTRQGSHGRIICDGLQWAHLITARRKRTAWLPDAAAALCGGCHMFLDGNPHEKIDFALRRLGEPRYTALRLQSQSGPKVDRGMVRLMLQQRLKELEGSGA